MALDLGAYSIYPTQLLTKLTLLVREMQKHSDAPIPGITEQSGEIADNLNEYDRDIETLNRALELDKKLAELAAKIAIMEEILPATDEGLQEIQSQQEQLEGMLRGAIDTCKKYEGIDRRELATISKFEEFDQTMKFFGIQENKIKDFLSVYEKEIETVDSTITFGQKFAYNFNKAIQGIGNLFSKAGKALSNMKLFQRESGYEELSSQEFDSVEIQQSSTVSILKEMAPETKQQRQKRTTQLKNSIKRFRKSDTYKLLEHHKASVQKIYEFLNNNPDIQNQEEYLRRMRGDIASMENYSAQLTGLVTDELLEQDSNLARQVSKEVQEIQSILEDTELFIRKSPAITGDIMLVAPQIAQLKQDSKYVELKKQMAILENKSTDDMDRVSASELAQECYVDVQKKFMEIVAGSDLGGNEQSNDPNLLFKVEQEFHNELKDIAESMEQVKSHGMGL